MTEVDDAESVAFGIRQHDEVRIVGIAVPVDTPSAQGHQSVGFRRLLGGVGDVQVQVEPRPILGRRLAPLERDLQSGSGPRY